jgi:hypothetical protein
MYIFIMTEARVKRILVLLCQLLLRSFWIWGFLISMGYIGSWLVKNLLQRGYTVNATLRNPSM